MPRVLLKGDGASPTAWDLKPGTVTIGRKPENDLRLEDATVSGHHAKVVTYFQSSYVQDLDSTNGTFVNGRRVRMHTLHAGDVISIGKFQLEFDAPVQPALHAIAAPDATLTMAASALIEADEPASPATALEPVPTDEHQPPPIAAAGPAPSDGNISDASIQHPGAYFQVMVGEGAGQRKPIEAEGCEILPGVRVQREGEAFIVRRAAGTGRGVVRLNSRDLAAEGATLRDMDMLQVNSVWLAFFSG